MAFPFVLLNRDPSINSRCLYICQIKQHDNILDPTIHVNQYVLRGLGADQDGDEVNLYYVDAEDESPSFQMHQVMYEVLRKSWKFGFRHDVMGKPRYGFSQNQDLLLFHFHKELCAISPFWKSLSPFPNRKEIFWALGCFTHRDEVDEFLNLFFNFCQENDPGLTTYKELLSASGIIQAVIDSGAKGSNVHREIYLKGLQKINLENLYNDTVINFDKYVTSNVQMKIAGRQQFSLLHVYQNIYLAMGNIYLNDTPIMLNVFENPLFSIFLYNPLVVKYHFKNLLNGIYD